VFEIVLFVQREVERSSTT